MLGAKLQAVQFTQDFDPPGGPLHVRLAVDILERAEGKIGLWTCQIVERAARGFREHPDRITSIKREDLRPRIAEPLSSDQAQRSGLARAGWPDNQSVAEVGDMQVHAKRRRSAGRGKQQRRTMLWHHGRWIFA